jgi:hypothetical protein
VEGLATFVFGSFMGLLPAQQAEVARQKGATVGVEVVVGTFCSHVVVCEQFGISEVADARNPRG